MNVVFLGGASGIGASCIAIQIGEKWILVDAGVRMDPNADRLPDLSALQGKSLEAIFITHAHADHIGALPLVHQEYPTVPIYASRSTMLLMEIMLYDALQVMEKRATTEFEVPLYDETMVASTLHRLYPIPLNGTITVPSLPEVKIYTARAGHVAGAMSIGFETPEGKVIVSGDVSVTPQHTVPGAQIPALSHPDLLILESTYGSRLHPNRQTEEERLAVSVAEGIERGGHVLIPAFALGRAQEVIRILHMAQRRGTIPEFPVWVDGLVRTVCSTYTAIPEALPPMLQRQIHKGYPPFFSGMIRPVSAPRQREQIVEGKPSCIVSSSGMLTGGPSAFYAAKIAENTDASILITGYQDDEAPGRRLLNLADQGGGMLELGEHTVNVRCHFNRYHLSAHADGNELTAMVSAIKPKKVALVHGDLEARSALAKRMERLAEIILPNNGQTLEIVGSKKKKAGQQQATQQATQQALQQAWSPDTPLVLESLWRMVGENREQQIVSVRELAVAWYGAGAGEAEEAAIQQALDEACRTQSLEYLYFIPMPDLPRLYRVRVSGESSKTMEHYSRAIQPGVLLLLHVYGDKPLPAVCYDVRNQSIWAYSPSSKTNRTRYPETVVSDVIGKWEPYPISDVTEVRQSLTNMLKAAQRWQRQQTVHAVLKSMEQGKLYTLNNLAEQLAIGETDLVGRLALALMLNDTPRLFMRHHDGVSHLREPTYTLQEGWQQALEEGVGEIRPDQMWILSVIEQHIGSPPDLYRRSVNPDTGEVTLAFHFPRVAREQYKEQLAAASAEAGVAITVSPQPHQGALTETAYAVLPENLTATKTSLHHERDAIRLRCSGTASNEAIETAIETFHKRTGWNLEIERDAPGQPNKSRPKTNGSPPPQTHEEEQNRLDLNTAMALTRAAFRDVPDFYKVSADQSQGILMVRFHFPDVAAERYADRLAQVSEQTGWRVSIYPELHQGAMDSLVRKMIPAGAEMAAAPSLHRKQQQVVVKVQGKIEKETLKTIQASFTKTTGWHLVVQELSG
jgi:Cft2 family RNA processing exonuclease